MKQRSLAVYFDNSGNESKLFSRVTSPAFLTRMKYLYIKSGNGSEAKWIATSRGVRQLTNARRSEKLFDSDFTSDDLTDLVVERYDVSFVTSSQSDDSEVYRVRAEPKRGEEYTRIVTIDRKTRLVQKVDFINHDETIVREYTVDTVQLFDGLLTVKTCTMRDLVSGTSTQLTVESFDADVKIPAMIFSRASL